MFLGVDVEISDLKGLMPLGKLSKIYMQCAVCIALRIIHARIFFTNKRGRGDVFLENAGKCRRQGHVPFGCMIDTLVLFIW